MKMKNILILLSLMSVIILTSCRSPYNSSSGDYDSGYYYSEDYAHLDENSIKDVLINPLSTFSIDVDTASYSNVRRYIMKEYSLPPADAVRVEELINYFSYDYPEPTGSDPISITTEVGPCPWNDKRQLAMIGLQAVKIDQEALPPSNLVFLLDVSGSMNRPDKLPLVKLAMKVLVNDLREIDTISIVVYAGSADVVLNPTSGTEKTIINNAIDNLQASGSTAGGQGINLAYSLAKEHYIEGGNNRVILATDGDFNVGVSSNSDLERLITQKREEGIYLSVLGFGTGNIKDSKMETLADKGNGNYAYIDSVSEAKKVLVKEMGSTLLTVAKDVKIQVEFNPATVKGYRLIGYKNRVMDDEDFSDDDKDAGEIGMGHAVTAFYEIIPRDSDEKIPEIDEFQYQEGRYTNFEDLMYVNVRYKEPESEESLLITHSIKVSDFTNTPSNDFTFASAVIQFGLLLKDSIYKGNSNYNAVIEAATASMGEDPYGYRAEFINIVQTTILIT